MRIHAIFIAIYLLVLNTPNLSADETQNRILYQDIEKDITFVEYQNPTTKSPWFYPPDNVKSVIKKYSKEAHMSAEETEKIMRTAPRFQLLLHMAEYSEMAVYRIGINMPNDTSLRFIPKALKLTILDLYGQIIEIQEFSIIFPIRLSPMDRWHENMFQQVKLTPQYSHGRPSGSPILCFVLLPKEYFGCHVLKVTFTDQPT